MRGWDCSGWPQTDRGSGLPSGTPLPAVSPSVLPAHLSPLALWPRDGQTSLTLDIVGKIEFFLLPQSRR